MHTLEIIFFIITTGIQQTHWKVWLWKKSRYLQRSNVFVSYRIYCSLYGKTIVVFAKAYFSLRKVDNIIFQGISFMGGNPSPTNTCCSYQYTINDVLPLYWAVVTGFDHSVAVKTCRVVKSQQLVRIWLREIKKVVNGCDVAHSNAKTTFSSFIDVMYL